MCAGVRFFGIGAQKAVRPLSARLPHFAQFLRHWAQTCACGFATVDLLQIDYGDNKLPPPCSPIRKWWRGESKIELYDAWRPLLESHGIVHATGGLDATAGDRFPAA